MNTLYAPPFASISSISDLYNRLVYMCVNVCMWVTVYGCVDLYLQKSVSSGAPGVMGTSQGPSDFGGRGTPASQGSRSSGGPTSSSGRSGKSSTKSLEYIYEQTTEPSPAVKPGIIALLEVCIGINRAYVEIFLGVNRVFEKCRDAEIKIFLQYFHLVVDLNPSSAGQRHLFAPLKESLSV